MSIVTRTSVASGVVGGLVHAGVAVVLWNHWFDSLWEMLASKPANAAYILLGMFLLGFVPVVFYVGERVISPGLVVFACLLASGFLSWLAGPVRAPATVPTPFALYVLCWVGVVALAGVAARFERRRVRQTTS